MHANLFAMAVALTIGMAQLPTQAAAEAPLRLRNRASSGTGVAKRYPGFGLGVRAGVAQATLKSTRLPRAAEVVSDDVNDTMALIVPTLHLGGDQFFFKLDVPFMRWDGGYTMGVGIYPLNYGHTVARGKLMPYASAGGAASVATMKPSPNDRVQVPLRAVMLQARAAAGLKWRAVPGVAISLEAGFSPYAFGGVVDDQRRRAAESALDAGEFPDLTRGNRPVSAGVGRVMDLALGVEWL